MNPSDLKQPGTGKRTPFRKLERHIWRRIASGFLLLVPVMITILIFKLAFQYIDGFFRPLVSDTALKDSWLDFPGIGILFTIFILYLTGMFLSGSRYRKAQDAVLTRVPIVKSIYSVSQQSIDALASSGTTYSRVVFVEWPRPGVHAMGFVTGYLNTGIHDERPMVVIYIPTVPNPTSGMLAWIPEEDVTSTDISVEEAMKAVFSGGMVLPTIVQPNLAPAVSSTKENVDDSHEIGVTKTP